jgi:hypothetical protein
MSNNSPQDPRQDLAELAERVRTLHKVARAACVTALRAAIDAGDVLIKAQTQVPPGS